jgi:DNA-binding transcriptional ArsR family regulator/uncharacterized protein YndB with AHSA1/START domain
METDTTFKALADANRRLLLDHLFQEDGQTLSQLCEYLDMTRYGVMKHLGVLEDAGLITTRKVGREKFHYLNAVPIQLIYDRWVGKYAQSITSNLTFLKYQMEMEHMTESSKPTHVSQIFIRTTPEKLWNALTDGDMTQKYYLGTRVESSWEKGADYRYVGADDNTMIDGTVVESSPFSRLVTTFNALWMPEDQRGETTTVIFEIEPVGDACKLTLTHQGLEPGKPLTQDFVEGWAKITSGLKTLLETGEPLAMDS